MKKGVIEVCSNKNKWLVCVFFVSFSLFFSVNVSGYKYFDQKYITVQRLSNGSGNIRIFVQLYNYSKVKYGILNSKCDYGYLDFCKFEVLDDGIMYTIMELKTPQQNKFENTSVVLRNKLPDAKIRVDFFNHMNEYWPEYKRTAYYGLVINNKDLATAGFLWECGKVGLSLNPIKVSGTWKTETKTENFSFYIDLRKANRINQSDDQKVNTDAKEINPVEVFGESDAVVVKGAESGATIKICNESGVEIKTVVANNNVVRIDLPAKQLYFIHIGNSQYKVTL